MRGAPSGLVHDFRDAPMRYVTHIYVFCKPPNGGCKILHSLAHRSLARLSTILSALNWLEFFIFFGKIAMFYCQSEPFKNVVCVTRTSTGSFVSIDAVKGWGRAQPVFAI